MKIGGKNNRESWYKRKDNEHKNKKTSTSILRTPFTNKSMLKTLTQQKIETMKAPQGTKTVIVEGGGSKLKNILVKPDPFSKESCDREDCTLKECRDRCYQAHVNYNIVCKDCDRDINELKYVYLGESLRGCYNRSKQHIKAKTSKDLCGTTVLINMKEEMI